MALELCDLKWKIRDLDADVDNPDKQIMELRQTRQKRCQEEIDKAMKGLRKSDPRNTNNDAKDFPWSRRMRMSMDKTFHNWLSSWQSVMPIWTVAILWRPILVPYSSAQENYTPNNA